MLLKKNTILFVNMYGQTMESDVFRFDQYVHVRVNGNIRNERTKENG